MLGQPDRKFELEFTDPNPEVRKKVFHDMITGANLIKDEVKKNQVMASLLGTMYEDMGNKSSLALASTKDNLDSLTKSMENATKETENAKVSKFD